MRHLEIKHVASGGLITNYYCTSRCRHCLYACSPNREKCYLEREAAVGLFTKVLSMGCGSVHIGGGEPFLDFEGLCGVMAAAGEAGMVIDYVETNSSWYCDEESAVKKLRRLRDAGLDTLLISISPFHNEHIPFRKVKGVIDACRRTGMGTFPWIRAFYPEVDSFDDSMTHGMEEYLEKFGTGYLDAIPSRYWVQRGGRALGEFEHLFAKKPLEEIISSSGPCRELADTSHFHVDLFGNYIPGLCSGFSIRTDDLGAPCSGEEYPLLTALYSRGIGAMVDRALEEGFIPEKDYASKCHLCIDIRRYLVLDRALDSIELQPVQFYADL